MKKEQQPAFPRNGHPDAGDYPVYGMTLRQYFAAKVMQILLNDKQYRCQSFDAFEKNAKLISKTSFIMADAMIDFEEKEGKE